jgi:hypothetical protein
MPLDFTRPDSSIAVQWFDSLPLSNGTLLFQLHNMMHCDDS